MSSASRLTPWACCDGTKGVAGQLRVRRAATTDPPLAGRGQRLASDGLGSSRRAVAAWARRCPASRPRNAPASAGARAEEESGSNGGGGRGLATEAAFDLKDTEPCRAMGRRAGSAMARGGGLTYMVMCLSDACGVELSVRMESSGPAPPVSGASRLNPKALACKAGRSGSRPCLFVIANGSRSAAGLGILPGNALSGTRAPAGLSHSCTKSHISVTAGAKGAVRKGVRNAPPYRAFTAPSTFVRDSFASPNSRVVCGSNMRSFSIPANPGRMDRLRNTTWRASATSRIGIP